MFFVLGMIANMTYTLNFSIIPETSIGTLLAKMPYAGLVYLRIKLYWGVEFNIARKRKFTTNDMSKSSFLLFMWANY